jgi:glycosyltransferase involved in cell wall biosynthesis
MVRLVTDDLIFQLQSFGGISRVYQEVIPRLVSLAGDVEVEVLTGDGIGPYAAQERLTNRAPLPGLLEVMARPERAFWPILSPARALVAARGTQAPAIWQSTYYVSPPAWPGPRVVLVHDLAQERFPHLFSSPRDRLARRQKRLSVRMADHVACNSESTRRDVLLFYNVAERDTTVLPLGCSDTFLHETAPASETPEGQEPDEARDRRGQAPMPTHPFILFVGSRVHYKGFDYLLEAFSGLPQPAFAQLVAVGAPWSAAERRRLGAMGLEGAVVQLGPADDLLLSRLYNEAAAFVYPSLWEGFGIPLLEAMARGCPVVATRIPSTQEVAGDVPIYFEPGSVHGLRAALLEALNEGRGSPRTAKGRERALGYTWDRTARLFLEMYRGLLEGYCSRAEPGCSRYQR